MSASPASNDTTPQLLEISAYNDAWPTMYEEEKQRLIEALGNIIARIDHTGSTSIPGMSAKPIIDIQISLDGLHPISRYKNLMLDLGYTHLSDSPPGDALYPLFHMPAEWPHTHHVHFCELGGNEEWRHMAYRDWLRERPEECARYSALKIGLAQNTDLRDPNSMPRYASGKSEYIDSIEEACHAVGYHVPDPE